MSRPDPQGAWDVTRPDRKDLVRAVALSAGYLIPSFVGPRFDRVATRLLERGIHVLRPRKLQRLADSIEATLGDAIAVEGQDLAEVSLDHARDFYAMAAESGWARIRGAYRHGWKPVIQLEGLDTLERARALGRGVILWRLRFCSSLVPKIALARAGIPVVHLSRWSHGTWGQSSLARRVAYPLFHRTEDRHLAGRVVIPRSNSLAYLKELIDHLSRGAVVSIFGDLPGRQNVKSRVLHMEASFPRGAPSLAWKVGSALLPMYAVRVGSGRYRVVIEDPVTIERDDRTGKASRDAYVEAAIHEFALRLESVLTRYPASWETWEPPAV